MKPENELALIIAFYLSKFDRDGLRNLGYSTFNEAYRDIEKKLGVKATSLKNRRDEFDPIHDNERVGWYQRPMSPSRVRIVQQLGTISEPTLRGIVLDILAGERSTSEIILKSIHEKAEPYRDRGGKKRKFVLRGPTGKKAEELFMRDFGEQKAPFDGTLHDCRDLGAGYDFRVSQGDSEKFIEVKGLDGYTGGVVLTDKEWRTAEQKEANYCLVIVSGIANSPKLMYIFDPFRKFNPRRNITTTVAVSWSVPQHQIYQLTGRT